MEVLAVLWKYRERVTLLFCIKEERRFGEVFSTDGKNKEKKGRGLRGLLLLGTFMETEQELSVPNLSVGGVVSGEESRKRGSWVR